MYNEEYWHSKKKKKFLHNIDTFYFSVKLAEDFTAGSEETENVKEVRRMMTKYKDDLEQPFTEVSYEHYALLYRHFIYAGIYNFCISCPEKFDFLFAPVVPRSAERDDSVTPEIVVQIRAELLWQIGATLAYKECMKFVRAFCDHYNLTITEIKENRCDFAWHTNALQDPETYFRIDHMAEMQVSRFKRINYSYRLYGTEFENDYINLGKRGDKCFIRIYLKTKEVVEKGYKGFFLKLWLFQGLISRYDLYVLERAYNERNWLYCDIARLQWKLEYDPADLTVEEIKQIRQLIDPENKVYDYDAIRKLANKYTPKITKVLNVEFQTMRKMTKSFILRQYKDNDEPDRRVLDFLDNRRDITDYLTEKTFRLIDPTADSNRSRCPFNDFWKRLRNTKQVDVEHRKREMKLVRDYSSQLDLKNRRRRALRSLSSYSMMISRSCEGDSIDDWEEILCTLNDNDFYDIFHYKRKRFDQIRNSLPEIEYYNELEDDGIDDY